ncbi:HAD hydrolase family protein [Methanopyrus sp.]
MPIVFDLEGPLSPMDHAYEVMARCVPNGREIFEIISFYDDIVYFEERREGYEPGTTLALIVPFLIVHGVTEDDLQRISENATLTPGARRTVRELDTTPFVASTSYEQHATHVAGLVGIPHEHVYCTEMPLDDAPEPSEEERRLVLETEQEILKRFYPPSDADKEELVESIDDFFEKLSETELGEFCSRIKVVGGSRKAKVVEEVADIKDVDVSEIACVGDSITDVDMLKFVRERDGLAVAFNGNEYCIPEADVAVAAPSLSAILPILKAFFEEGKDEALELAEELEPEKDARVLNVNRARRHELEEFIEYSEAMRERVRGEAGKLG